MTSAGLERPCIFMLLRSPLPVWANTGRRSISEGRLAAFRVCCLSGSLGRQLSRRLEPRRPRRGLGLGSPHPCTLDRCPRLEQRGAGVHIWCPFQSCEMSTLVLLYGLNPEPCSSRILEFPRPIRRLSLDFSLTLRRSPFLDPPGLGLPCGHSSTHAVSDARLLRDGTVLFDRCVQSCEVGIGSGLLLRHRGPFLCHLVSPSLRPHCT